MEKIIRYLSQNDGAKTKDIAASLQLSTARTRAILNNMDNIVATGEYADRRYWLKK